jgi:hypothetical protein|tara:strand:- start:49 stop:276 length:228 start_codon:yes stop_codon:yes gene_type:complete
MTYDIVNVQLTHPSFSWGNGLYAVLETKGTELRMCQIDKDGKPSLFDDGSFMITCTGTGNKEVYPTDLKLEYNGG